MKSAIEDVYFKRGANYEDIKTSDEYKRLLNELVTMTKEFTKQLTEEQKNMFEEMNWAQTGMAGEIGLAHFTAGFKLGLRIGVEINSED